MASEWRFKEGDRKSDSCSTESEYKNKLSYSKDWQGQRDKSQRDMLCKLCKKADESIYHVVSGCSKLAQKEYKKRYNNLGKIVHWKLARICSSMNMNQKVF